MPHYVSRYGLIGPMARGLLKGTTLAPMLTRARGSGALPRRYRSPYSLRHPAANDAEPGRLAPRRSDRPAHAGHRPHFVDQHNLRREATSSRHTGGLHVTPDAVR